MQTFVHTHFKPTQSFTNVILRSNSRLNDNPFTPILHLQNLIPHDILQSRLNNNSHLLYTLVLQYLILPQVSSPSPNPT